MHAGGVIFIPMLIKMTPPVCAVSAKQDKPYKSFYNKQTYNMKKIIFLLLLFFPCLSFATEATEKGATLSLSEAIQLAIRSNPNVQSSKLSLLAQKFNLHVAEWQFSPHYSLQASANYNNNIINGQLYEGTHNYNVQPAVTLATPVGTQLSLTASNSQTSNYNPGLSFEIMQPLMRGFGSAVVQAQLNNARDSAVISRLNVEGVLRQTVTNVVNAYLGVVAAERLVVIDEQALKRAETSVRQTKLFIKAGHKAGNELVTVKANVASAKTTLVNDKNNLAQARYALLAAIGIDPNQHVQFTSLDLSRLIEKYRRPTLAQTKTLTLENDIQYQTDQITLHGEYCRNLLVAKDNTRWQLNFKAIVASGNASGGGQNAGLNSVINGINQQRSAGLILEIPLDDQPAKQAVENAKIALRQAELALLQEKWSKQTSAINGWNNVKSAERALVFAEDAEKLQMKTYNMSYQKYLHGLIDSLELQTAQVSLIQAQQASLSARIGYLRALADLDQLIGNTLRTWKINVRL